MQQDLDVFPLASGIHYSIAHNDCRVQYHPNIETPQYIGDLSASAAVVSAAQASVSNFGGWVTLMVTHCFLQQLVIENMKTDKSWPETSILVPLNSSSILCQSTRPLLSSFWATIICSQSSGETCLLLQRWRLSARKKKFKKRNFQTPPDREWCR